jgi:secreted trypsin-like serine protease
MFKLIILVITIFSLNANAVVNSPEVNWTEYDNVIMLSNNSSYCSGIIVSGKYILTAAHCKSMSKAKSEREIYSLLDSEEHHSLDISIKKAAKVLEYSSLTPILLKENLTSVNVKIFGFGGTKALGFLPLIITSSEDGKVIGDLTSESYSIGGDSGGPWLNQRRELVAIHSGGHIDIALDGTETYITRGTNLYSARDFILETINGWHYPTLVDTDETGKATLTIQSLHKDNVDDNGFYADGDASIVNNTCTNVASYEKCTITIQSNGEQGQVYLSNNEVININKSLPNEKPLDDDTKAPNSNSGESGGSLNILTLACSILMCLRRSYVTILRTK